MGNTSPSTLLAMVEEPASGWNISATAAAIGTPRSNLYKKVGAYGISQEQEG